MQDVSSIAVIITLVLIGLGFLLLVLFSARNLINGKHSLGTILSLLLLPVVVLGISYVLSGGDPSETAVVGFMIMFLLALAALLLTGVKSLFT